MALVLSVKERGDGIVIGDLVKVRVTEVRGNKVRLAIDATREVTIHREAIYKAIKAEAAASDQLVNSETSERATLDDDANDSQARG